MEELGRSGALSGGMNMAGAEQSLVDQEQYGLMGVTQIGRGQSGTALQMIKQQASMAQQQAASDASAALNKSLANQQLIGQIAGSGTAVALHGYQDGWFGGNKQPSAGLSGFDRSANQMRGQGIDPVTGGMYS